MFSRFVVHPPGLYRRLYPGALWRIKHPKQEGRAVYLTFDDGPSPHTTPFILECLDKYNARATFFVVGENAERYPRLIDAIRVHGHSLGNHTMHHVQGLKTSDDCYLSDIDESSRLVNSKLFRPPHGFLRRSQYNVLRHDYRIVMFDIVTMDYDPSVPVEQMLANIRKYTRDGSIIVFHDSLKAREKVETVLPETLSWLNSEGYECRALPMD